ncbi:hypothetical protein FGB62_62g019 [Gracilaria domingensis]|nr:hypothetical protein FGB62_62g019 [Gracilaria domingensis]
MALNNILCVSALLLFAALAGQSNAQAIPRTISVAGDGSVSAPPDMATVSTGVVTTAATAQAALAANNQQFEQVLSVLAEQGIESRDVQTTFFDVNPQFQRGPDGEDQGITGYQVTNQVQVLVRELDNLGRILDALVTAGSNRISGVSFSIGNDTELRNRARSLAVADATTRAGVYAEAAGVQVGKLIAISEQSIPQPQARQSFDTFAAEASVPIATGELQVRATVFLQFEIADA